METKFNFNRFIKALWRTLKGFAIAVCVIFGFCLLFLVAEKSATIFIGLLVLMLFVAVLIINYRYEE